MNKYQEAFDFIVTATNGGDGIKKELNALQELVDKVTPMKIIHDNRHGDGIDYKNVDFYNCPRCRRRLRNRQHDNYCGRCGQRLDWSK